MELKDLPIDQVLYAVSSSLVENMVRGIMSYPRIIGVFRNNEFDENVACHMQNSNGTWYMLKAAWWIGKDRDTEDDPLLGMYWAWNSGPVEEPQLTDDGTRIVYNEQGAIIVLTLHRESQRMGQLVYPIDPELESSWNPELEMYSDRAAQSLPVRLMKGAMYEVEQEFESFERDGNPGYDSVA